MFNLNKALLSIIISAFAVGTTQPIDWGWLTNNSIYKQGSEFHSRLSQSDTYKKCATYGNLLLKKAKKHEAVIVGSAMIAGMVVVAGSAVLLMRKLQRIRSLNKQLRQLKQVNEEIKQAILRLNEEREQEILRFNLDGDLQYELDELSTQLLIRSCKPDLEPQWSNIRGLIANGANPNITDFLDGRGALNFAVSLENVPMVRLLRQHGANSHELDGYQMSPYALAEAMDPLNPTRAELLNLLTNGAHN